MPYVCSYPESQVGNTVGSGQCVDYVKKYAGAPVTSVWKQGTKVRGDMTLQKGTAIATFNTLGRYPNMPKGNHAAIYAGQDAIGIWVYDQWTGKSVGKRQIRFKGGVGSPSDDGDAYSVIN
jgi:hypothetical protein